MHARPRARHPPQHEWLHRQLATSLLLWLIDHFVVAVSKLLEIKNCQDWWMCSLCFRLFCLHVLVLRLHVVPTAGQGGWMQPGRRCTDDPAGLLAFAGYNCEQVFNLYDAEAHSLGGDGCLHDMAQIGWPVPQGTTRAQVCPSQCLEHNPGWCVVWSCSIDSQPAMCVP